MCSVLFRFITGPDAETSDVKDRFSSAGTVKSVLLVRESHSNLCKLVGM